MAAISKITSSNLTLEGTHSEYFDENSSVVLAAKALEIFRSETTTSKLIKRSRRHSICCQNELKTNKLMMELIGRPRRKSLGHTSNFTQAFADHTPHSTVKEFSEDPHKGFHYDYCFIDFILMSLKISEINQHSTTNRIWQFIKSKPNFVGGFKNPQNQVRESIGKIYEFKFDSLCDYSNLNVTFEEYQEAKKGGPLDTYTQKGRELQQLERCLERIEAINNGINPASETDLQFAISQTIVYKEKKIKEYEAFLSSPKGLELDESDRKKVECNLEWAILLRKFVEDMNEIGIEFKVDKVNGASRTVPDWITMMARWEILKIKYHKLGLKLRDLDIKSLNDMSDNNSFTLTYLSKDGGLSKWIHVAHDIDFHLYWYFQNALISDVYRPLGFMKKNDALPTFRNVPMVCNSEIFRLSKEVLWALQLINLLEIDIHSVLFSEWLNQDELKEIDEFINLRNQLKSLSPKFTEMLDGLTDQISSQPCYLSQITVPMNRKTGIYADELMQTIWNHPTFSSYFKKKFPEHLRSCDMSANWVKLTNLKKIYDKCRKNKETALINKSLGDIYSGGYL